MVAVGDVALYTGSLLGLTVVVATVLRYELGMGVFISSLTAISVTAAGLMVALALQVGLAIPFVWSFGFLAALILLFVGLYEVLT